MPRRDLLKLYIVIRTEQPIKILIQRRAAIGDVIASTGVIREFKRRYANSIVDVATDNIAVFRNNPHINNIILTHTAQPKDYDVYVNLDDAYELNPENNYVDSYFYRAFGEYGILPSVDRGVELFPSDEDCAVVDADIKVLDSQYIVVHMRNWHWGAKNIDINVWLEVYTKLFTQRADFKIVCVGGNTDFFIEEHPLFLDRRGQYNEQQIKHLCDSAQCFVGIDSGPYWCAAASSTHIVALLTHLHPDRILPYRDWKLGANCTAIQTEEDCRGCNDRQARPVRYINCIKQNTPCVSNFNTDAISRAILEQLR